MINQLKNWLLLTFFPKACAERAHLIDTIDALVLEHGECLDSLMALVSINEDGKWSTVFEADTVLPDHLQNYLHQLVART